MLARRKCVVSHYDLGLIKRIALDIFMIFINTSAAMAQDLTQKLSEMHEMSEPQLNTYMNLGATLDKESKFACVNK